MATLTGSDVTQAESTTAVNNLSSPVRTDWMEFPQSATSVNRKSGGGSTIGLPTLIGPNNSTASWTGYNAQGPARSWTGGTPTATGTNVQEGVFYDNTAAVAAGQGIQFVVPADTTQRVLEFGWFSYSGTSRVTAHLSDSSASDYTLNTTTTGLGNLVWHKTTITYAAGSASQTLTVQLTMQSFASNYGQVGIDFIDYTNSTSPSTVAVNVTAQNATSNLAASENFRVAAASTAQNATVNVQATVIGTVTNTGYVISTGTVALNDGSDDWVVYPGYGTTWGTSNLERRATGTGELPVSPTVISSAAQRVFGNGSGAKHYTWTNGTPDATGNVSGGIYTQGSATWAGPQGMRIPVPATSTVRVLKLFGWNYNGTAQVSCQFAKGGSPTVIPLTTTTVGGVDWYEISLTIQSPTPDTLYVDFVQTAINGSDGTNAYVGLSAMSLGPILTNSTASLNVTAQNATIAVAAGESFPVAANVTAQNATVNLQAAEKFPASVAVTAQNATVGIGVRQDNRASINVTAQNATPNLNVIEYGVASAAFTSSTANVVLDDTFDDWVDYPGFGSVWNDAGNLMRQAIGSREIPDFPTLIGAPTVAIRGNGSGTRNAVWTGGTPTASGTSYGGTIYARGVGTGFRISVPAAAATRTLKVYLFNWDGTSEVHLTFANGGGTQVVTPLAGPNDWGYVTVTYSSPVPTTLYVDLVQTSITVSDAQLGLQALTLSGGAPHNITESVAVTAQNATVNIQTAERFPTSVAVTAQPATVNVQATSIQGNGVAPNVTAQNAAINLRAAETFFIGAYVTAQAASVNIQSQESEFAAIHVTAQNAAVNVVVPNFSPASASIAVTAQPATAHIVTAENFRVGVAVTAQNAVANISAGERYVTSFNVQAQNAIAHIRLFESRRRFQAAILGPQ